MSRLSTEKTCPAERADSVWARGLELELGGRFVIIETAPQALSVFWELWPRKRRTGVQEAIETCRANLDGKASAHACKRAVLRAALACDIEVNRLWVRS